MTNYNDPLLPLLEQPVFPRSEHQEQGEQGEREHQEQQAHDSADTDAGDPEHDRAWLAAMRGGRKNAADAAAAWHAYALKAIALRNEMPSVPALPDPEEFWVSHIPALLPFAPQVLSEHRQRLEALIGLAFTAAAIYTHEATEFADLAGVATQAGEADR